MTVDIRMALYMFHRHRKPTVPKNEPPNKEHCGYPPHIIRLLNVRRHVQDRGPVLTGKDRVHAQEGIKYSVKWKGRSFIFVFLWDVSPDELNSEDSAKEGEQDDEEQQIRQTGYITQDFGLVAISKLSKTGMNRILALKGFEWQESPKPLCKSLGFGKLWAIRTPFQNSWP